MSSSTLFNITLNNQNSYQQQYQPLNRS